jgi:hypothetical protein
MWNVKAKVIPVIIRATGTISKSLVRYLSNIPGKNESDELQRTATFHTAHILQQVFKTYCTGEITLHVAQIAQDRCNTIHPRNMVCFRYTIVSIMHKGGDDMTPYLLHGAESSLRS